jgi:hypothetical protein
VAGSGTDLEPTGHVPAWAGRLDASIGDAFQPQGSTVHGAVQTGEDDQRG